MATSPPQQVDHHSLPPPVAEEPESLLSSLMAMENMLKMINEIDQNSLGIMEEVEKCKESALERKKSLEEEKEKFQKAAYTVLDMLNSRE
ncbi:polyamine-modulated factor 1-binding protein [Gossypium australe]|uniref:Polyamine-modulated factor 1-binding protein n=2 Tax=Gossypium TaxID=3633 RepID=A0A5B6UWE0_9ROSI|nr:polyamine-modulated factor 1-binding protein [Gossypium australe]